MKTSELIGAALDGAVARAEGREYTYSVTTGGDYNGNTTHGHTRNYSIDWSQGGPIIERERIDLHHIGSAWTASIYAPKWHARDHEQFGSTPLIAAMRCFVAKKLGDEVDVPRRL